MSVRKVWARRRKLYQQGEHVNGAGINSSWAVEHDATGRAASLAQAWAVGIGSPFAFETTLTHEYRSDIFGERAVLLGGVHGIVQEAYRFHRENGLTHEAAFTRSVESLTGPISSIISEEGLMGVYRHLAPEDQELFADTYAASYPQFMGLLTEIYEEVASGREIASVIDATNRLEDFPFTNVSGSEMWQIGEKVRANRNKDIPLDAVTAGLYVACMVAQADLLRARGHCWTEVANETIIEAIDSLNPFMHARGISSMVDNCSTTARLGDRKWHPRFEAVIEQMVVPKIRTPEARQQIARAPFDALQNHPVHQVLATCFELRPPVKIAVA